MQLARVLGVATVIVSAATTAIISCGGDSRPGGGGHVDAPMGSGQHDAATDGSGSGSGSATTGLGETCTPGTGSDTQGSCPTGFTCLNLQGGTNPWCSQTCVTGTGDMCKTGYTGPGLAQCILSVTPAGGGSAQNFCDVICEDDTSGHSICGSGSTCNDTCPGALKCTSTLSDGSGSAVGKACD